MLLLIPSTALAAAGSPDPTFGTRGLAELPQLSGATWESEPGRAAVLPDGRVIVPEFRTDYLMSGGEAVGVRGTSLRLRWLRADGTTERVSPRVVLPRYLRQHRVVRVADGSLLVIGVRYNDRYKTEALHVLRLSADGVPTTAPGGSAPGASVELRTIPQLGPNPGLSRVGSVSVAPNGRVYFVLRQTRPSSAKNPEPNGYGPTVIAAVDPSVGLASAFAGGGLVIAPASDYRTSTTVALTVDESGRLLVLVRSTRNGIGGNSQDVHLTRYDLAGSIDTSFAGGRIDIDQGDIDTAYDGTSSVAILRGGDVLARLDVATERDGAVISSTRLRRFLPTGQPAIGFGDQGTSDIVLSRWGSDGYGYGSSWGGFGFVEAPDVLEQPDGKLIITTDRVPLPRWVEARRDGIMRTTPTGALDTNYGKGGFARLDAPWEGGVAGAPSGIDSDGRVIAGIASYSDRRTRTGVLRLLAGDEPARATTAKVQVESRTCGATRARACFDPDGALAITGQVLATGGTGVVGADVVVSFARPRDMVDADYAPAFPAVRTGANGRFIVRLPRGKLFPGTWQATARVLATPTSQRVDSTRPVYFTLGPQSDMATMRLVRRAQALAIALDYVVDDTVEYGPTDMPSRQCMTPAACFRASDQVLALVSSTTHPAPGKAGLVVRRPGSYTIVARVRTNQFHLDLIITQTPYDTIYACRGDAAARKRWCPGGTWDDYFDDAFVTARINGAPFDW